MTTTMASGRKRVAAMGDSEQSANDLGRDTLRKISYEEPSDTIFECQDGKQVFASRLSLMWRWPWLKEIASNGDAGVMSPAGGWWRFPLPDIASPTLLFMMNFLYTGKMGRLNEMLAVDVVRACKSGYFELPKVEKTAMEFLTISSWRYGGSALRLTFLEFETDADARASSASLIQMLSRASLGPADFRMLSEKAMGLYLDGICSTTLFGEYTRFRQIILWCASQADVPDTGHLVVNNLVPGHSEAIAYLRTQPSRRTVGFDFKDLQPLLEDRQRSAARLLEKVNFVHIQSELLDAVVEPIVTPLKLVSEERLKEAYKKAYRLQAFEKSVTPPQYVWEHGSAYRVDGSGSVVAKWAPGVGIARYPVPVYRNYGIYEWLIVMEKPCSGFCEIGFFVEGTRHEQRLRDYHRRTVSGNHNGYCLKITPLTARTNQLDGLNELWLDFQKDFSRLNVRVTFRLDLNKRICFIAINDDQFLPAWYGLPSDVLYFPAVCLGPKEGGQVRIQLSRGFGIS